MPVDLVSIVDSVPGADCVVFNQMVFVPNQKREFALLDKKKNRHASMPNPSNLMAVEDIKRVQEVIAKMCIRDRKGLNKWIVLGRISYETGMYKFRSDESRRIG